MRREGGREGDEKKFFLNRRPWPWPRKGGEARERTALGGGSRWRRHLRSIFKLQTDWISSPEGVRRGDKGRIERETNKKGGRWGP